MPEIKIILDTNVYSDIRAVFNAIKASKSLSSYAAVWGFLKEPGNFNSLSLGIINGVNTDYILAITQLILTENVKIHVPNFIYYEFVRGYSSKVTTLLPALPKTERVVNEERVNEELLDSIPHVIQDKTSVDQDFPTKLSSTQVASEQEIQNRLQTFLETQHKQNNNELYKLLEHFIFSIPIIFVLQVQLVLKMISLV